MTVNELHRVIAAHLSELSDLFKGDMKLTFIARLPGNDEADVLVSDDKIPEILALLERRDAAGGERWLEKMQ